MPDHDNRWREDRDRYGVPGDRWGEERDDEHRAYPYNREFGGGEHRGREYGAGRGYGQGSGREYRGGGYGQGYYGPSSYGSRDHRRDDYGSRFQERGAYGQGLPGYGRNPGGPGYEYGNTGYGGAYTQGGYGHRGGYGGAGMYGGGDWRGRDYRSGDNDRGFFERAGDEVASWFGDDDAERRRRMDAREGDWGARHHRGRGPRGYTRSDDRIREDVSDRLTDDPHIDASDIEVSVSGGEVTLTGTVDSRFAKRHAEDIAERISGVRHVQNSLRVKDNATTPGAGTGIGSSTARA